MTLPTLDHAHKPWEHIGEATVMYKRPSGVSATQGSLSDVPKEAVAPLLAKIKESIDKDAKLAFQVRSAEDADYHPGIGQVSLCQGAFQE